MKSRLKGLLALTLSLVMMLSMVTVGWGSVNAQGIHVCDTADCLVCDVADKINALPAKNDITVNNAAAVTEQIHAIDRVKVDLTDDQYDELLTVVTTRPNSSGYGLAEPVRYMEALEKVMSLNAGGSLYAQKRYAVGSAELDWAKTDATLTIECLDAGSSFAPLSVTLADVEESSLAGFYSANADGWTNRYILPAGTYKITETGYNAVTTDGTVLTTTASYEVDGQTTTDYAIVTVADGEDYTVSVYNTTNFPVVGGVQFTMVNTVIDKEDFGITGDIGTATYDNLTSTLTLDNFVYEGDSGITADGSLTINLIGSNTVADTASATSGGAAVVVMGDLKITSENNGSLNASSSNNNGISANNITIDKADLTVGCLYGLNAAHGTGTVTISNGSKLTINATTGAINCSTLNFGGNWYQWSTDNTNFTDSNTSELTNVIAKGTAKLYIKPITYTVKFNANGGSGTMADATGVSGNYTLPANGFNAPVGDEFFGWSVDPAGAERRLPGETMQITRDTTVYAIWKYATLGNQGGGYPGTPQPPSIYYPIAPTTPEPEGEKVTSSDTFDGGIASAVVVTILSATGGAWLAKKKD